MKVNTADWLRSAQADLDTITAILNKPNLTPIVAFHVQQCVEKCLKALLEEADIEIRKTHNLLTLKTAIEAHRQQLEKLNVNQVKQDVLPFTKDPQVTDVWSKEFFNSIQTKLKVES